MRKAHFIAAMFFGLMFSCARRDTAAVTRYDTPAGPGPNSFSQVYFPFASDAILPEASEAIDRNADVIKRYGSIFIILEGHCDEVGPSEFNMELGDRRARAVKSRLIEMGVPSERVIMVVSYGSTRPLNAGHRIEDLRQNRRVEFVIR